MSLRWLPLCAGLAFLPALARLATELGAATTTRLAAVWLAAGLPALVYYSRELKPYGLDALAAAVVPLLALLGFGGSGAARRALIVALALLPWLTFGALFPALAVLAWGWTARWRGLPAAARRDWAIATAAFGASALAAWAFAWRGQMAGPGLRRFWGDWLLAGSDLSPLQKLLVGAERYLAVSVSYLFPRPLALPALALAALGAATWPAPQRRLLLWLHLGAAAFCIAAGAATDRYLLVEGRLLLFAAPTILLWVAQGLGTIGRWTRAGGLVLAVPIAASLWWSQQALVHRARATTTDPILYFRQDVLHDVDVIVALAAEIVPAGDPVLVSRYSAYAFQVYARGRLAQATYCKVYCFDEDGFVRDWLAGVTDAGWVILTDEEIDPPRLPRRRRFRRRAARDRTGGPPLGDRPLPPEVKKPKIRGIIDLRSSRMFVTGELVSRKTPQTTTEDGDGEEEGEGSSKRQAEARPHQAGEGRAPGRRLRSKSDVYTTIAEKVGITRRDVAGVFHVLGGVIKADLQKGGPGVFKVPGLMRITVQRKPATKARMGINPFTKEEVMFKAKPARNVVKVRPLRQLKEMV